MLPKEVYVVRCLCIIGWDYCMSLASRVGGLQLQLTSKTPSIVMCRMNQQK